MLLVVLVCSLSLAATGQEADNDWIDPYDMINYDASTKTMRKPAEPAEYANVPTKRREYTRDSNEVDLTSCRSQVVDQQRQIEELMKKIMLISQQPTCNPVFKRFLTRLRKEIQRVGLPSDSSEVFYDAKVKLSTQAMAEIQALLEGEDSWRTGALDNAISQILVDLRPHDYEAWKWRFEDTFGVELDTLLKIGLGVLIIVAIICTQLWSMMSWLMQFRRLFGVSFFVSIIWNWLYLYKIAFAEHQRNIAKMDSVYEKCTGVKKIDWSDSLKEWYRSTLTLQGDPCKKYYEVLMVNPILLVPPTKAIAVTITTFITEPLKHVGQGISEFLVALLKDLPITLQIPVLFTIVLAIVVCMYGGVQAAFQHGIAAPFRRPRGDPPPPQLEPPQPQVQRILAGDNLAGGDAPQQAPMQQAVEGRLHRNQVRQRQPNRRREEMGVESLGTAEPPYSEDETDAELREAEQNLSAESDSESLHETLEELVSTESDSSPSKTKLLKVNEKLSQNKLIRDGEAPQSQPAERPLSLTDVQICTCNMNRICTRLKTPPPLSRCQLLTLSEFLFRRHQRSRQLQHQSQLEDKSRQCLGLLAGLCRR
ncbi:chloride channel CLIC-like protein 1 isoform X1 [Anarrhichthys ocellatus]|uniref:chloride channel CLIC-like protein 1 isoform X1 n=1 Tax=Anarrhichthys ocellatus TaxID=433405 RepID=UPI0012ECDD3C|nr:chloride channel CLIC-like protein 1 isoform X1 [Anarrhichthys ocellatus]